MNRSLAVRIRQSAGTMSPTARFTISPTTTSSRGISDVTPSRVTEVVVSTRLDSFSKALLLLDSWKKRKRPEKSTNTKIMMAEVGFLSLPVGMMTSVTMETRAKTKSTIVKGLTKDKMKRTKALLVPDLTMIFLPLSSRDVSTPSSFKPLRLDEKRVKRSLSERADVWIKAVETTLVDALSTRNFFGIWFLLLVGETSMLFG